MKKTQKQKDEQQPRTMTDEEKLEKLRKDLPQKFEMFFTPEFTAQLAKVAKSKQGALHFQSLAAIIKITHDPEYSGLNSHPYKSLNKKYGQKIWESYVQNHTSGAWRIFWHYGVPKNAITFVLLTPHP